MFKHLHASRGVALLFALSCLPFGPTARAQTERAVTARQETVRLAPPAPAFDDEERRAELTSRRARVGKEVGPGGVLVLFSAEQRLYTGDAYYKFRQENNLFYLTHVEQEGATLVVLPGNAALPEILFMPRRTPFRETWSGPVLSPEEARSRSGVAEIWDSREFAPFTEALAKRQAYRPKPENILLSKQVGAAVNSAEAPRTQTSTQTVAAPSGFEQLFAAGARGEASLYLLVPQRDADTGTFGDAPEWRREQKFAAEWSRKGSGLRVRSAFPIFHTLRMRKSPAEVRRLQHAVDITVEALGRAMAAAPSARREYELEAEVLYAFRRRNAQAGYAPIVGAGGNATFLHYDKSEGAVAPGDLVLMDVGAEYEHYTADVTRTFPASGKFAPAQAEIYRVVLAAQDAAIAAARPGATLADVHNAAVNVVKDGLLRLGLIVDRDSNQYAIWFPHGTSHWLGMNVHDVGYGNAKLEPGMAFTVEPGIYLRPRALDDLAKTPENEKFINAVRPAFERFKGIGVRVEDDVLITPEGARNLSAALPRTIPDIESFIERAPRK